MDKKPLIDKDYLLQRFNGKGGWTYALIPEISKEKQFPFGLMQVSGNIDSYKLENSMLLPFGNGQLFLPVKVARRKAIKKEEGDWVKIILFENQYPQTQPDEIIECLKEAPKAYHRINALPKYEKTRYRNHPSGKRQRQ